MEKDTILRLRKDISGIPGNRYILPGRPDVKELVTEYQIPEKYRRPRKERVKLIRTLELLVIDEISMVRADILDAVDMTLKSIRRNEKPFGGVQLLMIGDAQQLSPKMPRK